MEDPKRTGERRAATEPNTTRQPRLVPAAPPISTLDQEQDFSVVLGGPLYQLYLRTQLARPAMELAGRRIVFLSLLSWLPLLLLSALEGHLVGGVTDPFLRDPEVHVRFLLALPLLIAAEVTVHERMRTLVPQFLSRGLVAPQDQLRYQKIVDSATRLRNSMIAEIVLLILAVTLGAWIWRNDVALPVSTWYAVEQGSGFRLTAAGWFYAFVSLSIFRFILFRWLFRMFVWYRYLWQVSRMPLHFNFYHPDRAGGLGFLSAGALALAPVFVAQSMVIAGYIYGHILYARQRLPDFKMEMGAFVILALIVLLLPLTFFAIKLEHAGRRAKIEFGILASYYVDDFRNKWVTGGEESGEHLLGTPDVQSLADLAHSFTEVNQMRLLPINKETLLRLVVFLVFPLVPLALTMFPFEEVLQRLFKLAL